MTTNRDWLFSLPLEEQYAWMNAEHQDGTLDGDTEPENEDSRERLEAEIESYSAFNIMDTITLDMVIGWLNRQAAITERKCRKPNWSYCETCEALEKLTVERIELQRMVDGQREVIRRYQDSDCGKLIAEREQYRKLFGMALDWAHEITMLESSVDEGMA